MSAAVSVRLRFASDGDDGAGGSDGGVKAPLVVVVAMSMRTPFRDGAMGGSVQRAEEDGCRGGCAARGQAQSDSHGTRKDNSARAALVQSRMRVESSGRTDGA